MFKVTKIELLNVIKEEIAKKLSEHMDPIEEKKWANNFSRVLKEFDQTVQNSVNNGTLYQSGNIQAMEIKLKELQMLINKIKYPKNMF